MDNRRFMEFGQTDELSSALVGDITRFGSNI